MRLILLVAITIGILYAEKIKIYQDGIILDKTKYGKNIVKIYLNHENVSQNEIILSGLSPSFSIDIPVANRWKVLSARAIIKYTPSIALETSRSFLNLKIQNYTLRQYILLDKAYSDNGEKSIDVLLPYKNFENHNLFTIQLYQHYVRSPQEDVTKAPEVWTQINLEDSYIELEIENNEITNELSSIFGSVFDVNNPVEQKINYVFHTINNQSLYNYVFFSSILGKVLQSRKIDFSVTDKIFDMDRDNLIIATTDQLREIFDVNKFGFQIKGNINIFKNPKNNNLALIIITAKTEEQLKEVLYSTFGLELNLNSGNSKIIKKVIYPEKAKAYSSPDFVSPGQKIYFKEMGYKSRTFEGFLAPPLDIEFKLYPDVRFQKKDKGYVHIDYIFPITIQNESISNLFINNIFISQVKMLEERDTQSIKNYLMMDSKTSSKYPVSLLQGGKNKLSIQFSMIPIVWNQKTLQASILESSYFEIPEADNFIAMADLKDFISSAYPYSIYPDLQDTYFLLTDTSLNSIQALMQIARFLGENIKYPPYYLEIGHDIKTEQFNKNIIVVGDYNDTFDKIYKNAPMILSKQGYARTIDLSNKFAESLEDLEKREIDENLETRTRFLKIFETTEKNDYLTAQFFQSPYNNEKTVLLFAGQNNTDLANEVKQIFDSKYRDKIKGDLVISKLISQKQREIFNFDIKENYFIGSISTISKIYSIIGERPLLFFFISLMLIILATYLLRKVLLLYKVRYHHDAD